MIATATGSVTMKKVTIAIFFFVCLCVGVGFVIAMVAGLIGWKSYDSVQDFASVIAIYGFVGGILISLIYVFIREKV